MCNDTRVPVDCEVFGLFRDLVPAELTAEGGEREEEAARSGPGLR